MTYTSGFPATYAFEPKLNYVISFPGFSTCRWQIVGLSLHNTNSEVWFCFSGVPEYCFFWENVVLYLHGSAILNLLPIATHGGPLMIAVSKLLIDFYTGVKSISPT